MRRPALIAVGLAAIAALLFWLWPSGKSGSSESGGGGGGSGAAGLLGGSGGTRPIEDRTPTAVGGRVTDADSGAGIAGAIVNLTEKSLDGGSGGQPGESPMPITARTGDDGRWALPGLPAGRYAVAASARGYVPGTIDNLVVRPRESREDIDVALAPGGHALRGTISDIGGGGIGGAIVRAIPMSNTSFLNLPWANFATISGPDGQYELSLGDGVYAVEVKHTDYQKADDVTEIKGGPRTLDFTMVPGGAIFGQVVTRDEGEPVPGAMVIEVSAMQGFTVQVPFDSVTADDNGRFVMRGVKSGSLELRAIASGYATTTPTVVDLTIGEQVTDVIVYVDTAYDITGHVVRKDDENVPVEGVLVGAYNLSPGALLAAPRPSRSDGYFEILGVPKGNYVVGALGEELVPNFSGQNVTLEDADVTDVKVLMDAGVTLTGRVEPPGPARIRIEMNPEEFSMTNLMSVAGRALLAAQADDQGNFALKAVTPGDITLAAVGDDGSKGSIPVEVRYADVDGLVIQMKPRPYVAGRVVDKQGQPVPNVRVQINPKQRGNTFMSMGLGDMVRMGGGGQPTDDDGKFKVTGLDPGAHEVSVKDNRGLLAWGDRAHRKTPRAPIEIDVAETPTENLELVVETSDGVLRGTVVGPDGAPVADAWVTAQRSNAAFKKWREKRREDARKKREQGGQEGGERKKRHSVTVSVGSDGTNVESKEEDVDEEADAVSSASDFSQPEKPVLTDAEGRFEITGLRDGSYDLEAEGLKGAARGEVENVTLGSDTVITLETLSGLQGKVTLNGNPVTSYTVEVDGPTNRRRQVMNGDGRYEVRRIEAGDYEVKVTSKQGSVADKVTVAAAATATLDLKLVPYSSIRGKVVDGTTGEPMSGLVIMVMSEGPSDMGETAMNMFTGKGPRTDADGLFRVDKVASGKGTAMFINGDMAGFQLSASREFTVEAGEDLDLGEIRGLPAKNTVPEDERGTFGMHTWNAKWEGRPKTDDNRDADLPDGMDADAKYLWVDSVDEGGPAAESGILVGDRITSIEGAPVGGPNGLDPSLIMQWLAPTRVPVGQKITIEIDRDGDRTSHTLEAVPVTSND